MVNQQLCPCVVDGVLVQFAEEVVDEILRRLVCNQGWH